MTRLKSGWRHADDRTIDRQDQHGANDGANEARALLRSIPADLLPEPGGKDRADNAEQCRDDEPAWPGDEELGDRAGEKSDDDDPKPMQHFTARFRRPFRRPDAVWRSAGLRSKRCRRRLRKSRIAGLDKAARAARILRPRRSGASGRLYFPGRAV